MCWSDSQVSLSNEWWEVWGCQHSQQSPVGGAGRTEVGSLRGGHKSEEQCFRRADSFHKSEAAKRIASSDPATEESGFGVLQILFRIKKPVLQFRFRIKNHFPSDLELKQFKGKFWESQQDWGRNSFSLEFFHNSRRDTAWKTGTGVGQVVLTVEPYSFQFRCKLGIFPENVPICQGKFGSRR